MKNGKKLFAVILVFAMLISLPGVVSAEETYTPAPITEERLLAMATDLCGGLYAEGTAAPNEVAVTYAENLRSLWIDYFDAEKAEYRIPYSAFLDTLGNIFFKIEDVKAYILSGASKFSYDEATDTVVLESTPAWGDGGPSTSWDIAVVAGVERVDATHYRVYTRQEHHDTISGEEVVTYDNEFTVVSFVCDPEKGLLYNGAWKLWDAPSEDILMSYETAIWRYYLWDGMQGIVFAEYSKDAFAPDAMVEVGTYYEGKNFWQDYAVESESDVSYVLPYDVYMETVDQLYVNHSDMKEYLQSGNSICTTYDANTDTVTVGPVGGFGQPGGHVYRGTKKIDDYNYIVYTEHELFDGIVGDGPFAAATITVEDGIWKLNGLSFPDALPDDLVETPVLTIPTTDFPSDPYYMDNGKTMSKFTVAGEATVKIDGTSIEADGLWFDKSGTYELEIEAPVGYEVTNVTASSGTVEKPATEGGKYKLTAELKNTVITVETKQVNTVIDGDYDVVLFAPLEDKEFYSKLMLFVSELKKEDIQKEVSFIIKNINDDKSQVSILDISLLDLLTNEKVQPNGKVMIRIPLPEGWNSALTRVYFVNSETNEMKDMEGTVITINGVEYMNFCSDHFSYYALVQSETHEAVEIPGNTEDETEKMPNTGDDNRIAFVVTLSALFAATVLLALRKKLA